MLTSERIRKESTTQKKALKLTIQHWWENYNLTIDELIEMGMNAVAANGCGLCVFYNLPFRNGYTNYAKRKACRKSGCKIRPTCTADRSLYSKAHETLEIFEQTHSESNYQEWRKAARAMHKHLCSLREKPAEKQAI